MPVGADALGRADRLDVGLEAEPRVLQPQRPRHLVRQPVEERGQVRRLDQRQHGAVHLLGAGNVLVGRGDDGAVMRDHLLQPLLQPLDQPVAQVDDLALAIALADQAAHHLVVLEHQVGVGDDQRTDEVALVIGHPECCFHVSP